MKRDFFDFDGGRFVVEYATETDDDGKPYAVDTEFFIMETRCHEVKIPAALCDPLDKHFSKNVFPGLVASAAEDEKIAALPY